MLRQKRAHALSEMARGPHVERVHPVEPQDRERAPMLIGQSTSITRIRAQLQEIARTDLTVLITGETGTGKEVAAQLIHGYSRDNNSSFVPVNCAAFPAELIEAELFGHEQGAFSGAIRRRAGLLEAAQHGTFFFDEVAELPLQLQAKLLRLFQEKQFRRLGSNYLININVRFIAATDRDLEQEVAQGRFRSDLYGRLQVCEVELPPLRQRREDIRLLTTYFAARCAGHREVPQLAAEALQLLEAYPWPRNVRELEHVIWRAHPAECFFSGMEDGMEQSARRSRLPLTYGMSW